MLAPFVKGRNEFEFIIRSRFEIASLNKRTTALLGVSAFLILKNVGLGSERDIPVFSDS